MMIAAVLVLLHIKHKLVIIILNCKIIIIYSSETCRITTWQLWNSPRLQ